MFNVFQRDIILEARGCVIEHSRERLSSGSDVVVLITLQSEPAPISSGSSLHHQEWVLREKDHGNKRSLTVVIDKQSSRMADNKEEEVAIVGKEVRSLIVRLMLRVMRILIATMTVIWSVLFNLWMNIFIKNIQKCFNNTKTNY